MRENESPSIIKRLEEVIREQWDCEALTDYGNDITYTYGGIAKRICYFHLLFESLGIKPGDKVAICDKNSSNWAIAMLAVLTYHAVAVPLLPDYSKEQLKMLCEHCDAKFMIASFRLANLWPEGQCPMYMIDVVDLLAMTPSIYTDEVEDKAYALFAQRYPKGFIKEHVHYEAENPDDLMILSYTSGSTGNPKGVMLPWRSLQSNMRFAADALPCEKGMKAFLILPMAHMFGFAFDFLYGVTCGAHLYILTKIPAPKVILEAFATVRPNYFLCVPLVMEKIIRSKVLPVLNKPAMKVLLKVPGIHQLICRKICQQLNLVEQQLALDDARQNMRTEIQKAFTNVKVAFDKMGSAQKAVDAAAVSVSFEQDRYDAGRSSVFDLINAQQKHLKASQDAVQAKYEYLIRQRILDTLVKLDS